jgi:hypothetical protein
VLDSGDSEADGVNAVGCERVQIAQDARAEFSGDFLGAFCVRVKDADELRARGFAPDADVVASEIAGTDDGNSNGVFAHDFFLASGACGAEPAEFAGAMA